jgi:hypothetical protein
MRAVIYSIFILLMFVWIAAAQKALPQSDTAKPSVNSLNWLAGCWEMRDASRGRAMTEHWMKAEGGMMIGMSRTIRDGKASAWEFMRMAEQDGDVFFVARPSQNATDTFFKMIRSTANKAVFEAPIHDFPQRVIYRRSGNALNARIEGKIDGKDSGIDFAFRKTSCP